MGNIMNTVWLLFASSCFISEIPVYEPVHSSYDIENVCFFGENKGLNASFEICFNMPLELIFRMQEGEI